ncbi:hypothetical protein XENTR_v10019628 [Xenopus tropicalis]|nr:hypothetical protein XENTR_v10019628 [Xenopus tropicalis]
MVRQLYLITWNLAMRILLLRERRSLMGNLPLMKLRVSLQMRVSKRNTVWFPVRHGRAALQILQRDCLAFSAEL